MPDLEETLLGVVIVVSIAGIFYLLNPSVKGWADKEVLPAMQQWSDRNLPTVDDFQRGFSEGKNRD